MLFSKKSSTKQFTVWVSLAFGEVWWFIRQINAVIPGMAHIWRNIFYGPLTRYAKLPVAHALGMPGTFSPPARVSDPDMHHGMCVTHVPWCVAGILSSGFLWSRWRGKRARLSRRMSNQQICTSGKRPTPVSASILPIYGNLFEVVMYNIVWIPRLY